MPMYPSVNNMGLTYMPTTKHAAFYGVGYASASEAGIVADQQAMVATSEAQAHRDLKMATIRRRHKARESRHSPAGTTRSNSKTWLDYHRAGHQFDLGSQAGEGQVAPPAPTTAATSRQRHRRLPPTQGPPGGTVGGGGRVCPWRRLWSDARGYTRWLFDIMASMERICKEDAPVHAPPGPHVSVWSRQMVSKRLQTTKLTALNRYTTEY
jgi:hypothetical protein